MTVSSHHPLSFQDVTALLQAEGFLFLPASRAKALFDKYHPEDWEGFCASWNNLGLDLYMADGGRYRRRRYGTFSVNAEGITRKPHQPHYQSRDYNPLNGDIERWFNPIEDHIARHPALFAIIKAGCSFADTMTPEEQRPPSWHTEIHQFRIEAKEGEAGLPTPEGMHRDGVDWVFVVMIRRENIRKGCTTIYALDKKVKLGSFILTESMDTAIVDDHRVFHGVTDVEPVDPSKPAWRDVLVMTMRHE